MACIIHFFDESPNFIRSHRVIFRPSNARQKQKGNRQKNTKQPDHGPSTPEKEIFYLEWVTPHEENSRDRAGQNKGGIDNHIACAIQIQMEGGAVIGERFPGPWISVKFAASESTLDTSRNYSQRQAGVA